MFSCHIKSNKAHIFASIDYNWKQAVKTENKFTYLAHYSLVRRETTAVLYERAVLRFAVRPRACLCFQPLRIYWCSTSQRSSTHSCIIIYPTSFLPRNLQSDAVKVFRLRYFCLADDLTHKPCHLSLKHSLKPSSIYIQLICEPLWIILIPLNVMQL